MGMTGEDGNNAGDGYVLGRFAHAAGLTVTLLSATAQSLMALVLGSAAAGSFFGLLNHTFLTSVSFGYTQLPFWPQGKPYEAYFTDAGGISPGNDVNVSGIKVGKVTGVELAGDAAKVTFTVDRDVRVGDQSLVAIKTDTVLGEKSLAVTPQGSREATVIPLGRTTTPYTLNTALQDLGQNASELDKPKFEQALLHLEIGGIELVRSVERQ